MLREHFEIFPGVGPRTAAKLRTLGVKSWPQSLELEHVPKGIRIKKRFQDDVREAMARFEARDTFYFNDLIKPKDGWRLFSAFPEKCVFFDIETTGLSPQYGEITVICTYRPASRQLLSFVRGENLDSFPDSLRHHDILVGFNSLCFDLPFVQTTFGGRLPQLAHIDLRWVLYAMNIRGSLKAIERREFGIRRPSVLDGFAGEEAVWAWMEWKAGGDRRIRDLLVLYCAADTYVLDYIARECCRRLNCPRFAAPLDPHSLLKSTDQQEWVTALPDIPEPVRFGSPRTEEQR